MLFFQGSPPDTSAYMFLGYGVILFVIGIYLASLAIRHRNLRKDLDVLREIQDRD